jgi:hypothetical protein
MCYTVANSTFRRAAMAIDHAIRIDFKQDGVYASVTGRVCAYDLWSKKIYNLPRGDDLAGLELEAVVSPNGKVDVSTHYVGHGWLDVRLAETIAHVLQTLERAYRDDFDHIDRPSYGDCLLSLCKVFGIRHLEIDWPAGYRDEFDRDTDPDTAAVHVDQVISDKAHDYYAYEWQSSPY